MALCFSIGWFYINSNIKGYDVFLSGILPRYMTN